MMLVLALGQTGVGEEGGARRRGLDGSWRPGNHVTGGAACGRVLLRREVCRATIASRTWTCQLRATDSVMNSG